MRFQSNFDDIKNTVFFEKEKISNENKILEKIYKSLPQVRMSADQLKFLENIETEYLSAKNR